MNVQKFMGKNSKEALNMVRKVLGKEAVILSNKSVNGVTEIMAFKEEDMNALIHEEMVEDGYLPEPEVASAPQIQQAPPAPSVPVMEDDRPDFTLPNFERPDMGKHQIPVSANTPATAKKKPAPAFGSINEAFKSIDATQIDAIVNKATAESTQPKAQAVPPAPVAVPKAPVQTPPTAAETLTPAAEDTAKDAEIASMINEMRQMRSSFESQMQQQAALKPLEQLPRELDKAPINTAPIEKAPQQNPQIQAMLSEMRNMRSAFESQLTSMNWANITQRDPIKSKLLNVMLSAGFSASLSRQLAEKLPNTLQGQPMTHQTAMVWMKHILALNLDTVANENTLFDQGGIFALIGPTGVGKTTTTAKLAARYVMKHGTENLGIITTDAYRVGGHEQLRIYGKILGVMVHAVKDETDLKIALNELKGKHTILIDTVGVSQKDSMVADQIAMLSSTQSQIKKLLCVNATSTGATLTDVVRAYKGKGLDGAILTKIDEAATIGNALDVVIRNKLKLYFATNGQRVPEDIMHSNKDALVAQAFARDSATQYPYEFLDDELPFIMGHATQPDTETSGA